MVIVVATAEALVGLGILVAVYRGRASLDVDDQNLLRY
ncbi:MAG: NADH-quinone oxidoreductase subunit K [Vicinamibacteria bacterium]